MDAAEHVEMQALFRRYFPIVREKCARMLADPLEAEDVAQETFIKLWQEGPSGEPAAAVKAWLYRVSTHAAIDHLRRARRTSELRAQYAEALAGAQPCAPDRLLEGRRAVAMLAKHLSHDDMTLAILTRLDGMTQGEVAAVLKTSERSVRRAVAHLEKRLAQIARREAA